MNRLVGMGTCVSSGHEADGSRRIGRPFASSFCVTCLLFVAAASLYAQTQTFSIATLTTQRGDGGVTSLVTISGTANSTITLKITYPTATLLWDSGAALGQPATTGWSITGSESPPGTITIDMSVGTGSPVSNAGILNLTFDTLTTAPFNDTTGSIAVGTGAGSAVVDTVDVTANAHTAGTVRLIGIYQGAVTGSGDVTAADAQQVLLAVASFTDSNASTTLDLATELPLSAFGVQTGAPSWATLSGRLNAAVSTPISVVPTFALLQYSAFAVADVDEDGVVEGSGGGDVSGVTAVDAAQMLRFAVGIQTTFGASATAPPPAPRLLAGSPADLFRVASTSARPGAQMTVSFDLSPFTDVYAGELRFDYDRAVLRPVDVRIESTKGDPLIAHSTQAGDLGIAFASAYPIEGGVLHAVFEAAPGVQGSVPASIRARRLVINKTRFEPAFQHRFTIEPYRFELLANFPNPFNPETWIPFELAEESDVTVRIYGMDGALVRALDLGRMRQGVYMKRGEAAYWDGRNAAGEPVASGVYIYELAAGDYRAMRRMVLVK